MKSKKIKNIGFISTRFKGTDGVSLETLKWEEVLKRMGYSCFFFSGLSNWDPNKTHVKVEAFFGHPEIVAIQKLSFNHYDRTKVLGDSIHKIRSILKEALYEFLMKFKIDLIIIENASSVPMNIPFGIAITELIAETGIPTIGHHHDFHWEREKFIVNCVNDYIQMAFPPSLPSIKNVVINSEAGHQLSYRKGLSSTLIPNVFDFKNVIKLDDEFNKNLRSDFGLEEGDLFFFQPTRVIPRKGIDQTIELVSRLKNPKIKVVIAHTLNDDGNIYLKRIIEYAQHLNVTLILKPHLVGDFRKVRKDGTKKYTLWDVFSKADFICYPSRYEGFGNAFLEAIYFKKPILINRYSVYKKDIEPIGFHAVTIDDFILDKTVKYVQKLLLSPDKVQRMVDSNFKLAKKYFSYEILEKKLAEVLSSFN